MIEVIEWHVQLFGDVCEMMMVKAAHISGSCLPMSLPKILFLGELECPSKEHFLALIGSFGRGFFLELYVLHDEPFVLRELLQLNVGKFVVEEFADDDI